MIRDGLWEEVHDAAEHDLYRLKSHSDLIVKVLWLLALGVDASALEEVFGVREITIPPGYATSEYRERSCSSA